MTIRIDKVYTRSGDSGETGLVGGARVHKSHPRVVCYGEIDELNAVLGCCKEHLSAETAALSPVIEQLQQELFDIGSELATPRASEYDGMWKVRAENVTRLEELCDSYGKDLPQLSSFVLPGGSKLASFLHLARTVSRRAERSIVSMAKDSPIEGSDAGSELEVNAELIKYCNRLSDLLFILSRWVLKQEGTEPVLWVQAKDRSKRSGG